MLLQQLVFYDDLGSGFDLGHFEWLRTLIITKHVLALASLHVVEGDLDFLLRDFYRFLTHTVVNTQEAL